MPHLLLIFLQARDEALAALADQEECYLDFEAWEDREAELLRMGQAVRDSKAALEASTEGGMGAFPRRRYSLGWDAELLHVGQAVWDSRATLNPRL